MRSGPARVEAVVAQTDIAATVLGMLGLSAAEFPFSHNVFDPSAPNMAFFSDAEHASVATPASVATLNVSSGLPEEGDSLGLETVKAYLQILYNDLQQR